MPKVESTGRTAWRLNWPSPKESLMTEVPIVARRPRRKPVKHVQAAMAELIPEIERLAARFVELGDQLEPRDPPDLFGRPGREHLRSVTAGGGEGVADLLLRAATYARHVAERTHADLMAQWEKDQKRELPGYLRAFGGPPAIGG